MCNSSLGELTTHTALRASKQLTALVVEVLKSFVVLAIHLAHLLNLSSIYTSLMERDPRFKHLTPSHILIHWFCIIKPYSTQKAHKDSDYTVMIAIVH